MKSKLGSTYMRDGGQLPNTRRAGDYGPIREQNEGSWEQVRSTRVGFRPSVMYVDMVRRRVLGDGRAWGESSMSVAWKRGGL